MQITTSSGLGRERGPGIPQDIYLLFFNITCRRQQHDMLSDLGNTSQLKHYKKLHQFDVKENRKGERSKMDNPNTQATLGTRHRTKKNSTYNTTQHKILK